VLSPLRDIVSSIPSAQAEALRAALGWGPPASAGRFLVGAAMLSVLSAAASTQPLLLAIDDVHWVDVDSAAALLFAARRLGHDRVATVITHRAQERSVVSLDGLPVITLEGLRAEDARALLGPGFSCDVVSKLVTLTGGNPLALRECRQVLSRAQRAGAAPLPAVLPVPQRWREVYAEQLRRLSPGAWRAAVLAAAEPGQASAPVLAALTTEGWEATSCVAEAGGVLVAQGGVLGFRHPLLRSATWQLASASERLSAHDTLASVTDDRAVRTWHAAEATLDLDAALADELAAVAEVDRARSSFGAASRAAERAAQLTPNRAHRAQWLAVATEDAFLAGDVERARRLAHDVLSSEVGADPRARALLTSGMIEWFHGPFARARVLFEQAVELATGRLLLRTLSELFHTCHVLDDTPGMVAAADRAAAAADRSDPEQDMLAAYLSGAAHIVEGRLDAGAPLVQRAIQLLETDPVLRDDPRHLMVSLLCARWLMDPGVAVGYADRRIDRAREVGAFGVLATGLALLSMGLVWMGDHVRAHAFAGEAVELLEALGVTADPGTAYEAAAMQSSLRCRHDDARRLLDRAKENVVRSGFDPMPPHLARVVALCAFCRGDLPEVVEVLEDQVARFNGVGAYLEPLGVAPLLVEAYLGLGRHDDAASMAVRYAAAQSDRPHPQVAALAARCDGLVAVDLDQAVTAFERSLAAQEGLPDRLELARTRLLYGMRLRREGQRVAARPQLATARREFLAMDLTLWAERAGHELAGTGERVQAREATHQPLTSQETRVAVLVAQGLKNREVAAVLFLSPKTVEHHLAAVLRKRGLRSRTELARTLAVDLGSGSGDGAGLVTA
jgi:DNA-binding NarL/FixJ family response regulator